MATIWGLDQPRHRLPLLKHGSVVQTKSLNPVAQATASVTVQQIPPVFLVHRHHLTLHALRAWHRLPEPPAPAVGVTEEAECTWCGQAELSKTFSALNVVGVGRDEQAAGLQLDTMTWTQGKGGPF